MECVHCKGRMVRSAAPFSWTGTAITYPGTLFLLGCVANVGSLSSSLGEVELIQKALNELDRESAAFCIGCLLGGIQAISFLDANPEPGSESFSKVSAH